MLKWLYCKMGFHSWEVISKKHNYYTCEVCGKRQLKWLTRK